jgi:hypothetical protein
VAEDGSVSPGEKLAAVAYKVDEDRDLDTFLRIQEAISSGRPVTPEEEELWRDHNVNSRDLEKHLRQHGQAYDAIVIGPYLLGLTLRCAAIHPARTFLVPCLHDEAFAYLGIMRGMFHQVHGLLFNAGPEQALAERLYGLPAGKGQVIGMGLESFAADKTAFARQYELSAPYLMYCGRREGLKGTPMPFAYVETFLERTGRPPKLVYAGSGADDPSAELRPHCIDLGFATEDEKHLAMAGARCFIHPSVNESLGIVLLESWLAGTPALVNGMGEVLTDHCRRSNGGLWFRNYPEFEEMLLRLLDDDALHAGLAENGRRYVLAEYSWEAINRKLTTALTAAL